MRLFARTLKSVALLLAVVLGVLVLWLGWTRISIKEESVAFKSGVLTLRGTLLSPRFGQGAPGIVLVHGSGPTSRKATIVYAWLFASRGYAALAYDKRGVGQSDGGPDEWREFSFDALASDAVAGYRFLQARSGVAPSGVGFFGASQGGWVVALAANRVATPAFLIFASASFSTVAEDRLYGREAQVRHAVFDGPAVSQAVALLKRDQAVTRTGAGLAELQAAWSQAEKAPWFRAVYPRESDPLPIDASFRQWERRVLDFDPQPLLQPINAPALWIFGDPALDRFSPVALSVARVEQARASGRPYEIIQIAHVGHTLDPVQGSPVPSFFRYRLPLLSKIFHWLDALPRNRTE